MRKFQSTLSSREVTENAPGAADWLRISIHTSLTGSDLFYHIRIIPLWISIHTSLTGSDREPSGRIVADRLFQSTLPSREVTKTTYDMLMALKFQSTLPSREVTTWLFQQLTQRSISIHTSLTGSDYRYSYSVQL